MDDITKTDDPSEKVIQPQDGNLAVDDQSLIDPPLTKAAILSICKQAGLSIPEVSKVLGYNKDYAYHIAKKLSPKYDLTSKHFVRLASNVIKKVLKCEPTEIRNTALDKNGILVDIIKDIYPKPSEQLNAAQMVYDRVQPIKQAEAHNTFNLIQINIDGMDK